MQVISVEKINDYEFVGQVCRTQALLCFASRVRLASVLPARLSVHDCVFSVEAVVCTPESAAVSQRRLKRPSPCAVFGEPDEH